MSERLATTYLHEHVKLIRVGTDMHLSLFPNHSVVFEQPGIVFAREVFRNTELGLPSGPLVSCNL